MKDNVGKTVFHFFAQGIEKYFGPVLLASQSFCEIKQGINVKCFVPFFLTDFESK